MKIQVLRVLYLFLVTKNEFLYNLSTETIILNTQYTNLDWHFI